MGVVRVAMDVTKGLVEYASACDLSLDAIARLPVLDVAGAAHDLGRLLDAAGAEPGVTTVLMLGRNLL